MKITDVTYDDIVIARRDESELNKFITSLIVNNQGFLNKMINRYDKWYDQDELYQEALLGLHKAIVAFNTEKAKENNNKFITYAQRVIMNRILDSVKKQNKFYKHNSSIEQFKADESSGYYEQDWKKKDIYKNFDDCLTDKIQAERIKETLSVNEKMMFDCRVLNKMKVKDTLKYVSKKSGISESTARMIYYNSFQKKIKEGRVV